MISTHRQKYLDDRFFHHATEFGGGMFFAGEYAAYGYSFNATRSDVENFKERKDASGVSTRREQKNNQRDLYGRLYSIDSTIAYRLQECFADLPAKEAREKVAGIIRNAYIETWAVPSPIPTMTRRHGGGRTLIPAVETKAVAVHLTNDDGSFGPHVHEEDNGVVFGSDGRPGTRPRNDAVYFEDRFKQVTFHAHIAHACREKLGLKNVQVIDGIAKDPTVTKEQTLAAGIGVRQQKIVEWLAHRGIHPTRQARLIANYQTREKPPKTYHLEERAAAWKAGIEKARALGTEKTPEKTPEKVPEKERQKPTETASVRRAFKEAAKVARWIYLGIRHKDRQTYRLRTREQLTRLIHDTKKKPFWVGMKAAKRAVIRTNLHSIEHACEVATRAHLAAVKPTFTPDKNTRLILSKELSKSLSSKEVRHLLRLSSATSCQLVTTGVPLKELLQQRQPQQEQEKRSKSRSRQY
jgi:hypothetical protein